MRLNIHLKFLTFIHFCLRDWASLFKYYRVKIIFSLLSIIIGIAAISAMISIKKSVDMHAQELMDRYDQSRYLISLGVVPPASKRKLNHLAKHLGNQSWQLNSNITLIPYAIPGYKIAFNLMPMDSMVVCTVTDLIPLLKLQMAQGRRFHTLDRDQRIIIIGSTLADKLQAEGINPIGSYLSIQSNYFKIVGVLQPTSFDPLLDFDVNNSVLMGLEWLYRLSAKPNLETWLVFSDMPLNEAIKEGFHLFKKHFNLEKIYTRDLSLYHEALFAQIRFTIKILCLIAAITLILGMISILNLLLILLDERKNEIGLRLALGATSINIGIQFLRETLFLNLIGAIIGLCLGQILAFILSLVMHIHFYFVFGTVLFGIIFALGLGIVIGIIPAIMAAKLKPYELMRG